MSDRPVVLICPKIPPTRDGVGDYTYRLGAELAKRHSVTIVTTEGQQPVNGACRIVTVPDWTASGMSRLWPLLEELQPSFINVQWVPFLWGRWGVNVALPLMALQLRRAGYRVVTTVHEPYVPFDMWKRVPMGAVQRLELWTLLLGSAKVAVTISPWTRMFQTRFFWRKDDFFWLPVGSAIPPVAMDADERVVLRKRLGAGDRDPVVTMFNPLGTGKMLGLSTKAWDAIRRRHPGAVLLLIGCDARQLAPEYFPDRSRVVCAGYVDSAEASRLLSASDLCLAPYIDGMSARRSSVMAVMEHGVPIVSTRGRLTDSPVFRSSPLALADVDDEAGFIAEAERLAEDVSAHGALRDALQAFYQRNFSWPVVSKELLRHGLAAAAQS